MKTSRNILTVLLGVLGLGAIGGGTVLVISPSGERLGIPLTELKNAPFDSYLIPGIVLCTVLGIVPLLLILALRNKPTFKIAERLNMFKDMHWSWTFTMYIAFSLIGWIQIQMIFLRSVHWLHTFYMAYAIIMIVIALLPSLRSYYKKKE